MSPYDYSPVGSGLAHLKQRGRELMVFFEDQGVIDEDHLLSVNIADLGLGYYPFMGELNGRLCSGRVLYNRHTDANEIHVDHVYDLHRINEVLRDIQRRIGVHYLRTMS